MPPFSSRARAHRAPCAARAPRPPHGSRTGASRRAAATLGAAAVLVSSFGATVATAAPVTPAYPTVFISQSNGSSTQLKQAIQSRLANAGAGGVEIANVGSAAGLDYNAVGYRVADSYLYAIASSGQLVRIEHDGATTQLGTVAVPGGGTLGAMYSGAFGEGAYADTFFVRATSGSTLYLVDVPTRTATTRTLSQSITNNDFAWAYGYLWGVEADTKKVVRIDVATGTVTKIATTGVFPAGDANTASPGYGAAWTYGNGNLAVSNNDTGNITQFSVANPSSALPTVTKVSTILGPSTSRNDAATTPSTPADLALTVVSPAPAAPSSPISWTVTVTNNGPGGSSGSVVSFPVPAGVTDVVPPVGCTVTTGVVQCVTGPLPATSHDEFTFTATAPTAGATSASSTITIVGNEADPVPGGATLAVTPAPTHLTSTGVGTTPQTVTVTVPPGGSVTLLDADDDPAATVTVPGQGTYVLNTTTGVITFTPVLGFTGAATPVAFEVDGPAGSTSGDHTPTVLAPVGPVATALTSTGTAPAAQSPASPITIPSGGSVALLDAGSSPATSVAVSGQGSYSLNTTTGVVTFTPAAGFTGVASAVSYRITDAYGQTATSTYTPTVSAPALTAPDRTTTGPGPLPQSTALPVPAGGSISLIDGAAQVTTVTIAGQGTYVLDASTGTVTFTPAATFVGTATPVTYRVVDVYGTVATATYTPTVTLPAPPVGPALSSSGPVVTPQQTTAPVPSGGSITLLDDDGDPTTTVTIPGVGTYVLDPATGLVVFTPVFGFAGAPPTVDYRVTDRYGQTGDGTYAPAVVPPAPPAAPAETSTGVGTTPQRAGVTVPTGGSVTLLDTDGDPATVVTVPGHGTYTLDPATGAIEFEPELGFHGPASVPVRVTNAYGQSTDGTYTPTVQAPPAPGAPAMASGGAAGTPQSPQTTVPVPTGGSVQLLDAAGDPAASVTIPGQGTYTVDPATGTLTFTPVPGFTGTVAPVTYRVTDAYGQSTDGSYTATVAAPPAPPVPGLPVTGGDPTGLVLLAAGLLLGGAALVLAARRRPTGARAHGLA